MKRRLMLMIPALIAAILLAGCSVRGDSPEEILTDVPTSAQTEPLPEAGVEMPVDEDVFYFSNELEYYRLYSQRYDGTELKLVQDVFCYDVRQAGDSVYFLDGENLCVYHIPSGEKSVLIADTFDYALEGENLVYYRDLPEAYLTEIRYLNLNTGEDVSLGQILNGGDCDIANGILYYTKYDQESGRARLCVCDLAALQTRTLANELSSFYRLQAVPGGVYFEGIGEDYTSAQYFASADGRDVHQVEAGLTDHCQMFHESDEGVLCVYSFFDGKYTRSCIHRHNSDGTVTEILWGKDDGYFTVEPLDTGRWLLKHTFYEGWGSPDSDGIYENYIYRLEYILLDAQGNTTPIDVTGEIGKLFFGGDFPVMDSSTARKIVTKEIYNLFVANYGYEGTEPLCSTTHGAWLNIADRKVDIALLAAPTEEEMDYLTDRGVSVEMKLYGGDGLVFIGNAANPVSNLTHEQIIAIYRGEITNWSEVGGPDHPITIYYRDDQSGSQRLFEEMVFKGLELPDYESLGFAYMDEMSTIVDIVLMDPYSIGYSIMTYLDDVYENEELKVFAVNGVEPSVETVKNSTYPYHTQGYVVIRSDEPDGSPARRLYDWFGTPVCNEILNACGITPLQSGVG